MYLRYRASFYNEQTGKTELGFLKAADYLVEHATMSIQDKSEVERLIKWFDIMLPIPEYYQEKKNRQLAKSATSWFKDSACEFINGMNDLSKILESNHIAVERISCKKVAGKKIYEDDFQITVLPFKDSVKKVQ